MDHFECKASTDVDDNPYAPHNLENRGKVPFGAANTETLASETTQF